MAAGDSNTQRRPDAEPSLGDRNHRARKCRRTAVSPLSELKRRPYALSQLADSRSVVVRSAAPVMDWHIASFFPTDHLKRAVPAARTGARSFRPEGLPSYLLLAVPDPVSAALSIENEGEQHADQETLGPRRIRQISG